MNEIALLIGLLALAVGAFFYWKSRQGIGPDEASRIVKQYAEQQKVELNITPQQMEAIRSQWIRDPSRPAQITFYVDGKAVGEMKIATCPYWSDTCCA
jgi:hypothetical protein